MARLNAGAAERMLLGERSAAQSFLDCVDIAAEEVILGGVPEPEPAVKSVEQLQVERPESELLAAFTVAIPDPVAGPEATLRRPQPPLEAEMVRSSSSSAASASWASPTSYQQTQYELRKGRPEAACAVPAVNLTGLVLAACAMVTVSWFVDEVLQSATSFGDVLENGQETLASMSRAGYQNRVTVARAGLALCGIFVVAVWAVSAYIKVFYLTTRRKEDGNCPKLSW